MMFEPRYKLHWITVPIETVKAVKDAILPVVIVLFTGSRNNDTGNWFLDNWSLLFGGLLALFLVTSGFVQWRRFTYWFEDGELRIESGLFVKKKRYIPFERIQSFNYTEGILHRIFGLVKVEIETAASSSDEANAELTAVTREAADSIKRRIMEEKKAASTEMGMAEVSSFAEEEPESHQLFSLTTKQLFILATTSSGIGVIFSGAAIFVSQFGELLPLEKVSEEVTGLLKFGVLLVGLIIFLVLILAWLLSVGMTFLAYYGFAVRKTEEDLIITRGLIEKKRITVPLSRIQSVSVQENPLRQLFGYARVVIHSAGSAGDGARIQLFPLVKKTRMVEPLQTLFPELDLREPQNKLPKRGRRFYYRLNFVWVIPVIGLLIWAFYPYGLWSLLLVPIIFAVGSWQHHSAAYYYSGNQVTIRRRGFSLETAHTYRKRIQSAEMSQTFFQKRKKVATLHFRVKSGVGIHNISSYHMDQGEAEQLLAWYEPRSLVHKAVEAPSYNLEN